MPSLRTVLFDLDDTLFDHLHAATSGLASIRPHLPRFAKLPLSELEDEYKVLLEEIHQRVLSGELDLDRARRIRMARLMSDGRNTPSEPEAAEVARLFRESYQQNRRTVEGAKKLLAELRRRSVTVAIVTNNQTREQEEKLDYLGLEALVDFMITSEEVGSPKPDPHIFEIALEWAGCTADEAVVVGDSWTSDIAGAANAGIRAVWYNPHGLPKPENLSVGELSSLQPTPKVISVLLGE